VALLVVCLVTTERELLEAMTSRLVSVVTTETRGAFDRCENFRSVAQKHTTTNEFCYIGEEGYCVKRGI